MKEMSRYLLGVVTDSLRGGSPTQHPRFNHVIECTRAVLEFYMHAWYESHDDATLSYMEDAVLRFHNFKDVFLLGRAGKQAKANANAQRRDLMKMQKVDEETNADTWTASKKWWEMNAWRDYTSHEIDVSKEMDANFNFPKIHLISHWVSQIHRNGSLQQYSAEWHEHAHNTNLQDGWNAANHHLNYLAQVITVQHRILCFEIIELNLQALAQRRENSAAACIDLPSGADLAAPLSSQSYARHELLGPHNRRDATHPDAMIKDFRALLDNTPDATHRVARYCGTWQLIMHISHNKTYISVEQLLAMKLCIYHGNKVQVEGLDGEHISHMCRWTGSQSWHGWDRWNCWVLVKQRLGRCYRTLNGRLPWQLQQQFEMKLPNEDQVFVEVLVSPGGHHNAWKLG